MFIFAGYLLHNPWLRNFAAPMTLTAEAAPFADPEAPQDIAFCDERRSFPRLKLALDLTAELITHRFTPKSKAVQLGWYPGTALDLDESSRSNDSYPATTALTRMMKTMTTPARSSTRP